MEAIVLQLFLLIARHRNSAREHSRYGLLAHRGYTWSPGDLEAASVHKLGDPRLSDSHIIDHFPHLALMLEEAEEVVPEDDVVRPCIDKLYDLINLVPRHMRHCLLELSFENLKHV